MQSELRPWWIWLNIALIASSAATLLVPGIRQSPWFMWTGLILYPTYFVGLILRLREQGNGQLSLDQLYEKAKKGRRLRHHPLELAAIGSMLLVSFFG